MARPGTAELDLAPPLAAGPPPVPGHEDHHGPADADEEAVGTGHVGQGQGARRFTGGTRLDAGRTELLDGIAPLPGEDEVDGVLGEHGDEGEHGDGGAGRHVELGHLGRPGQQERRTHDGQAEQHRLDGISEGAARQLQPDAGDHDGHGHGDGDPLASRVAPPDVIVGGVAVTAHAGGTAVARSGRAGPGPGSHFGILRWDTASLDSTESDDRTAQRGPGAAGGGRIRRRIEAVAGSPAAGVTMVREPRCRGPSVP